MSSASMKSMGGCGWRKMIWIVLGLLALFGGACSEGAQNGDAGLPDGLDAGDGVDDPLQVGSEQTFEIASWNIRNFPTDSQTVDRVADIVQRMDIDLLAVEEIADVDSFNQMVGRLDGYAGVLSPDQYSSGEYQKTGFIYRTDMVQIGTNESIFDGDSYAFPRPPLQVPFEVERPRGGTLSFVAIVLHLKADSGAENEARRRSACEQLKTHVDELLAGGEDTRVVVLGDFNDLLLDPPASNVFEVFLNDEQNYSFLDSPLDSQGDYSYIPMHLFLDHILVTSDLLSEYAGGTTEVVHLDQKIVAYDYVDEVSDHRPLTAIFPL